MLGLGVAGSAGCAGRFGGDAECSASLADAARDGDAGPGDAGRHAGSSATAGFLTQNYLTGNWGGIRDEAKKDGISFTPVWTAEVFGNPSGGARQGVITDGLVNLPLDLDLDPLSGGAIKDTIFHVNAFYIYGARPIGELRG